MAHVCGHVQMTRIGVLQYSIIDIYLELSLAVMYLRYDNEVRPVTVFLIPASYQNLSSFFWKFNDKDFCEWCCVCSDIGRMTLIPAPDGTLQHSQAPGFTKVHPAPQYCTVYVRGFS